VSDVSSCVFHRSDGHLFLVETPILAAIDQFTPPFLPGENRLPHVFEKVSRLLTRLKHARSLAKSLIPRITGKMLECFIDPDDCAVPSADEDGIGGGFKGSGLKLKQIFCACEFRDGRTFWSICRHTSFLESSENRLGKGPGTNYQLALCTKYSERPAP
jgi:hypothetical protein